MKFWTREGTTNYKSTFNDLLGEGKVLLGFSDVSALDIIGFIRITELGGGSLNDILYCFENLFRKWDIEYRKVETSNNLSDYFILKRIDSRLGVLDQIIILWPYLFCSLPRHGDCNISIQNTMKDIVNLRKIYLELRRSRE